MPLPKLENAPAEISHGGADGAAVAGPAAPARERCDDPFTAWRDRLVMELLYGGGLRVSELTASPTARSMRRRALPACSAKDARNGCARWGAWPWRCSSAGGPTLPARRREDPVVVNAEHACLPARDVQRLLKRYLALAAADGRDAAQAAPQLRHAPAHAGATCGWCRSCSATSACRPRRCTRT